MTWWRHVVALEFRKILAYRSDFWVTFIGQTLLQLLIARAFWSSVFHSQNITEMNGYTLPMMTLYYLIVPIGTKILQGENIGFLSRDIYDGSFTKYLIYPLSPFVYKAFTYLTYVAFYSIQLILIYSLFRFYYMDESLSLSNFQNLFLGVMLFICGSITYMFLTMMIELLALYADNIWSLVVMLRFFNSFLGGGMVPISFFPEWAQDILSYLPFASMVSLPVRTVLGQTTGLEILNGVFVLVIWTIIFMGGASLIWKKGQKLYTGVGI
jgi:ABC-2 type transport system permease protein